jgi:hypothetical protein
LPQIFLFRFNHYPERVRHDYIVFTQK